MPKKTQAMTPEQLAAVGHWNGEVVESAHEQLFDLVERYRTLRGISFDSAVAVVHGDIEAGRMTLAQTAFVDVYRRWRARCLGTAGVSQRVSLEEFAFWMRTGQFIGAGAPATYPAVLKLGSPTRQAAFAAIMVRLDGMVQQEGLSVGRAAGRLVNEAACSSATQPCETRRLLQEAMGRGGRNRLAVVAAVAGLPSIDTLVKWYARHRTGAVQSVLPAPPQPRKWLSRESRWLREAQRIKAAQPGISDLAVYSALMAEWRSWWGQPVGRKRFLKRLAQESW